jgi:hypothetical protein
VGRGRRSTQLILSHFPRYRMSSRLKQTKELGQGTKVCTNSPITGVFWLTIFSVFTGERFWSCYLDLLSTGRWSILRQVYSWG